MSDLSDWDWDLLEFPYVEYLNKIEVQLVVALVCALVLVRILLWCSPFGSSRGGSRYAVIAGPCNAGKTALFYQLTHNSATNGTVASMQENESTYIIKNDKERAVGSVRLVDVPGHPRLRHKLEKHLKDACAVVLVVDAADITPHKVEAAEELFEVLTHPTVARRRVPVLLACNKMDQELQAHSLDFIKRTLEKQLDAMRKTRASMPGAQGAGRSLALGKADKPFSLATARSAITSVGISALAGDVAEVRAFLLAHCK